jgi:hypothetical protein
MQLLVQDLDVLLRPFANPSLEEGRKTHLLGVCKRAEQLGMLLLSQPAEWAFDWNYRPKSEEAGGRRQSRKPMKQSLVVFPGLIRLTDNSAGGLPRPRVVLEPVVKG